MKHSFRIAPALVLGTAFVCAAGAGAVAQSPAAEPAASAAPAMSFGPIEGLPAPGALIAEGTLTDCVDVEYPPLEFYPSPDSTDPNTAIGFDVDSARAIAAALGLKLNVVFSGFDALIPDLQAGRCDMVMSGLYINDTRLQVADAVPYMQTGHVIMVPAGNPKGITGIDSLCGLPVSFQSGGLVEERISKANEDCKAAGKPEIGLQGYPKVADELQQIALGRVDAVWETAEAVADLMLNNPGVYEVAYSLPRDNTYGIYVNKDRPELKAALEAAVQALKDNGTLAAIAQHYQLDPAALEVAP